MVHESLGPKTYRPGPKGQGVSRRDRFYNLRMQGRLEFSAPHGGAVKTAAKILVVILSISVGVQPAAAAAMHSVRVKSPGAATGVAAAVGTALNTLHTPKTLRLSPFTLESKVFTGLPSAPEVMSTLPAFFELPGVNAALPEMPLHSPANTGVVSVAVFPAAALGGGGTFREKAPVSPAGEDASFSGRIGSLSAEAVEAGKGLGSARLGSARFSAEKQFKVLTGERLGLFSPDAKTVQAAKGRYYVSGPNLGASVKQDVSSVDALPPVKTGRRAPKAWLSRRYKPILEVGIFSGFSLGVFAFAGLISLASGGGVWLLPVWLLKGLAALALPGGVIAGTLVGDRLARGSVETVIKRYEARINALPGVTGISVALTEDGRKAIAVSYESEAAFREHGDLIPELVDGYKTVIEFTRPSYFVH